MKRLLAFSLALILLFGIAGSSYMYFGNRSGDADSGEAAGTADDQLSEEDRKVYSLFNTAVLQMSQEDYDQAYATADRCLEIADRDKYPDVVTGLLQDKATIDIMRGDTDKALKLIDEALSVSDSLPTAYLLRAKIYLDSGNDSLAKEALVKYVDLSGDSSEYYDLGILEMKGENYTAALDCFNRYVDYLNENHQTDIGFYYRGICFLAEQKYKEAADDFSRCVRAGIEEENSLYNRSQCYLMLEDYEAAKADLTVCAEKGYYKDEAESYLALLDQLDQQGAGEAGGGN